MSDCAEYTISFEDEILEIKEILELSLNIIFFHRYLGNNNYEEAQSQLNNISYVKVKNEKLSNELTNNINEIENNFKNNNQYAQQLTLYFYEKEKNKKDLKNPWEIWNFILILSKKEEVKDKNDLNNKITDLDDDKENKIRKYIFKIIEKLNDKENYMPNININDNSLEEETFSHNINIDKIYTKEDYLSLLNHYIKKNQENVIVINHLL